MSSPADAEDAAVRPYLVVLQSDLISGLSSTVVAPLVPRASYSGAHRLNPIVTVEGEEFWLATQELFAVDRRILKGKLASLADHRDAIVGAIDFVFFGF